jgi:hypothetical protein
LLCLLVKGSPDELGRLCGAHEDVAVPDAEEAEALRLKVGITDRVAAALGMLRTIGFDDELFRKADKVDDVGTNRDLAAELELNEATVSQEIPKTMLCFSGLVPHSLGESAQDRRLVRSPVAPRSPGNRGPLIRPSGTFSLKGRRGSGVRRQILGTPRLPLSP